MLLFNKRPSDALAAAEEAASSDPAALGIEINRAHALLFLDRFEVAKLIYIGNGDKPIDQSKTFAQAVRDDFAEFRKYGIDNPRMKEIETLFTQ